MVVWETIAISFGGEYAELNFCYGFIFCFCFFVKYINQRNVSWLDNYRDSCGF